MRAIVRNLVFAAAVAAGFSATPAAAQNAFWFNHADRNQDGQVTRREYERSQESYDALRMFPSSINSRLVAWRNDFNHDGRLTRMEYDQSLRWTFNRYDRDRDGVLTRADFAPAPRREKKADDKREDNGRSGDRRRA
ncbi:hypothetical protein [Longimicrobium sp.]|uniref:hypothetical protein n=1 Tax=Longimicrobium sp. TaxID=2029185 RepID=UPI002E2F60DD|nr:hypothetical protein [Longimicrobium sp.]HEX6041595.1 hypothetical protein [Longimicrobium sp.]